MGRNSDKNELPPWISLREGARGQLEIGGPLAEVVGYLVTSLNVSYVLRAPADRQHGQFKNNSWTGLIGMLHRKEADVCAAPFVATRDRWRGMRFSYGFVLTHLTILSGPPDRYSHQSSFLQSLVTFHWTVWVLMLVFGVVLVCFALCVDLLAPSGDGKRKLQTFPTLVVIGGSLFNPVTSLSRSGSGRLVAGCWGLSLIILTTAFGSNLRAQLTLPEKAHYIDSLRDLLDAHKVTPTVLNGTNYHQYFNHSDPVRKALLDRLTSRGGAVRPYDFYHRYLEEVPQGWRALVTEQVGALHALAFRRNRTGSFHLSRESFYQHFLSLGLGKHVAPEVVEQINTRVLIYISTGHIIKYEQTLHLRSLALLREASSDVDTEETPLTLPNITSVFCLWGLCLLGCAAAIFLEYGYKCVRPLRDLTMYVSEEEGYEMLPQIPTIVITTADEAETAFITYHPPSASPTSRKVFDYTLVSEAQPGSRRVSSASYTTYFPPYEATNPSPFKVGRFKLHPEGGSVRGTTWAPRSVQLVRRSTMSLAYPKDESQQESLLFKFKSIMHL